MPQLELRNPIGLPASPFSGSGVLGISSCQGPEVKTQSQSSRFGPRRVILQKYVPVETQHRLQSAQSAATQSSQEQQIIGTFTINPNGPELSYVPYLEDLEEQDAGYKEALPFGSEGVESFDNVLSERIKKPGKGIALVENNQSIEITEVLSDAEPDSGQLVTDTSVHEAAGNLRRGNTVQADTSTAQETHSLYDIPNVERFNTAPIPVLKVLPDNSLALALDPVLRKEMGLREESTWQVVVRRKNSRVNS